MNRGATRGDAGRDGDRAVCHGILCCDKRSVVCGIYVVEYGKTSSYCWQVERRILYVVEGGVDNALIKCAIHVKRNCEREAVKGRCGFKRDERSREVDMLSFCI